LTTFFSFSVLLLGGAHMSLQALFYCAIAFACYVFAEENAEIDAALLRDYVKVPGGRSLHKSCVHHAPEGSIVSRDAAKNLLIQDASGQVTVHPPCPHRSFFTLHRREKRDEEEAGEQAGIGCSFV
jgi:hypothetical protein